MKLLEVEFRIENIYTSECLWPGLASSLMKTMFTCTVFIAGAILMPHLELSCQHAESDMFNWLQSTHHMNTCGYRVWYYSTSGQSQLYS